MHVSDITINRSRRSRPRHLVEGPGRHSRASQGRHLSQEASRRRPGVFGALGWVVDALLVVAVIAALLVAYGLIDNRWYRIVVIQGSSMTPTLSEGDAIVITRPPVELEPGMVVTMQVDGRVVTHRVAEVASNGSFLTIGDANTIPDDWGDNPLHVVGVQRLRIPLLGHLLSRFAGAHDSAAFWVDRSKAGVQATAGSCFGACEPPPDSAADAASTGSTSIVPDSTVPIGVPEPEQSDSGSDDSTSTGTTTTTIATDAGEPSEGDQGQPSDGETPVDDEGAATSTSTTSTTAHDEPAPPPEGGSGDGGP